MTPTKALFRNIHLWLGLSTGLIIVFVCLTGSILALGLEAFTASASCASGRRGVAAGATK